MEHIATVTAFAQLIDDWGGAVEPEQWAQGAKAFATSIMACPTQVPVAGRDGVNALVFPDAVRSDFAQRGMQLPAGLRHPIGVALILALLLDVSKLTAKPNVFIHWKDTDVCLDFECACGVSGHFDGCGAYHVHCASCGRYYKLPTDLALDEVRSPDGACVEPTLGPALAGIEAFLQDLDHGAL